MRLMLITRRGNEARYLPKVDERGPDECWPWLAGKSQKGYGIFNVDDPTRSSGMRTVGAHRYAWERANGPVPAGMVVDHLCFNRTCQNPAHMRLLTSVENSLRANRVPVTHCKRGHEFTDENTRRHSVTNARVCATCQRDYRREWARQRRAA